MSKYITLNTVNMFSKLQRFEVDTKHNMTTINAPYCIDDSKFCPTAEALKNINGTPLTDEQIANSYDFPDGKDNGMSLPIGRGRFSDITELSTEVQKHNENLTNSYNEFKDDTNRKEYQKKRLDMLNAVKDVVNDNSSTK